MTSILGRWARQASNCRANRFPSGTMAGERPKVLGEAVQAHACAAT
jgi:hypothetical protein